MPVALNMEPPFVAGADETAAYYVYTDAAATAPLDITGRTYRLDICTVEGATPSLSLTGTVTGASGLVTFTATDTQTAALALGTYVYAVWETSGTNTTPIVVGALVVQEVAGS